MIGENHLFKRNDTLIVALSGGADSSALLDLLARLPGYNLRLVAAHLNHCLRGTESDEDENFCRKLSDSYQIPFEVSRVDVKELSETNGLNLEDAGRRARIEFLDQIRAKYAATAVVTAHHRDDQAETILMRLLRGSGMTGLSGISHRNQRGYIRPLLGVTRAQIEQYLEEHGLSWREDASNRDTNFLRNRIRHELLPLLERYNPAIRHSLIATAAILSDEDELLATLAEQVFDESWHRDGDAFVCDIKQLKMHPVALQRRILRHVFKQLSGNLYGLMLVHIESIRRLLNSPRPNVRVALPQGISAVREYDRLLLRFSAEDTVSDTLNIIITGPGNFLLPDGGLLGVASCSQPLGFKSKTTDSAFFDLNKTPFPWLIRTFRPGDRMVPFGMNGTKKVKEIFIDRKIPLAERKRIPLLFCGEELIWLAGLRSTESGRVCKNAINVVTVNYVRA